MGLDIIEGEQLHFPILGGEMRIGSSNYRVYLQGDFSYFSPSFFSLFCFIFLSCGITFTYESLHLKCKEQYVFLIPTTLELFNTYFNHLEINNTTSVSFYDNV